MKRRRLTHALGALLTLLACVAGGYFLVSIVYEAMGRLAGDSPLSGFAVAFLLAPSFFILSFFLHVIIHEVGHLVFGLLSGYRFVSFRIFSLTLVKRQSGYALKKYRIPGSVGQCLLAPKLENSADISIFVYNIGGGAMNIIVSLPALLVALLSGVSPYAYTFFAIFSLVGALLALTNLIPARMGGIANDGCNALMLRKNKSATIAFSLQLSVNAALSDGKSLTELPDGWFSLPDGNELSNIHSAAYAYLCAQRLLYGGKIQEAHDLMQGLLKSAQLLPIYEGLVRLDMAFCEVAAGQDWQSVKKHLTSAARSISKSMPRHPSVIRTEYALASLRGEAERAAQLLRAFDKISKTYPYEGEIADERYLVSLVAHNEKGLA